jgi:hypothetical protein
MTRPKKQCFSINEHSNAQRRATSASLPFLQINLLLVAVAG